MTPDEQQSALKRCLALRPLTGWPEWGSVAYQWRLSPNQWNTGEWRMWFRDQEPPNPWEPDALVSSHEALCLWQAHFLDKLGEYTKDYNELVQIHMAHGEVAVPGVSIYGAPDAGSHAPTLIEALLGFFEQIQKEQNDEAV